MGSPRGVARGAKQQMIYKHAISTITPERPVDMSQGE